MNKSKWTVCKSDIRNYFYIANDTQIYEDIFGNTITFSNYEEAQETADELNEGEI